MRPGCNSVKRTSPVPQQNAALDHLAKPALLGLGGSYAQTLPWIAPPFDGSDALWAEPVIERSSSLIMVSNTNHRSFFNNEAVLVLQSNFCRHTQGWHKCIDRHGINAYTPLA